MKRIAGLGLMLGLALVQVTWAPHLAVGGAFPNLVLVAVVGITWAYGVRAGLAWACVGGVLLDLTASGAVGPHALALLAGAFATSLWARDLERPTGVHLAVTAALATVLYSFALVVTYGVLGLPAPDAMTLVRLTVASAIFNAVLMPFAFEPFRRMREVPEPS